jgi:hypothetical protein
VPGWMVALGQRAVVTGDIRIAQDNKPRKPLFNPFEKTSDRGSHNNHQILY